jgi:putative transposase
MNRGHNREAVFLDDDNRLALLHLLARYRQRFGFRLFLYCLVANHVHLVVQFDQAQHLSPFLAGLLRAYVHHCHRRHGFVGHRWQGRFQSPAIGVREYLLSCGRYVERNSVEARLVAVPWDYAWLSAQSYALG